MKLYLGVDLHKKSCWVTVMDVEGRILESQRLGTERATLLSYFGQVEKPAALAKVLGGARNRILAYASIPLLPDVDAYLRFVDAHLAQGFRAAKLHASCLPERDLELTRVVRRHWPDRKVAFVFDAENNYNRTSAVRVAEELHELGFEWFEAPLPDSDLDGYRELTRRVRIPILPAGAWIQDLTMFVEALRTRSWTTARTDVRLVAGLRPHAMPWP